MLVGAGEGDAAAAAITTAASNVSNMFLRVIHLGDGQIFREMTGQPLLLIVAVVAVGVLHTMVPDHWAPIALLARARGWNAARTARAAAVAGLGHTVSTLILAAIVWLAGAALAARFGHAVEALSSAALIVFGAWIAIGSLREMHSGHTHMHRHADGTEHRHWHAHDEHTNHAVSGALALAPIHRHAHETSSRTALLFIVGSSPMVEGIPAFFAASRYGALLLGVMALLFATSTIATYVVLCTASGRGIQRLNFGRFEEYGEVISGSFIALLGIAFLIFPWL